MFLLFGVKAACGKKCCVARFQAWTNPDVIDGIVLDMDGRKVAEGPVYWDESPIVLLGSRCFDLDRCSYSDCSRMNDKGYGFYSTPVHGVSVLAALKPGTSGIAFYAVHGSRKEELLVFKGVVAYVRASDAMTHKLAAILLPGAAVLFPGFWAGSLHVPESTLVL